MRRGCFVAGLLGALLVSPLARGHGVEEATLLEWIRMAAYDLGEETGQAWDRLPRGAQQDLKRQIHDSYTAQGLRGRLTKEHVAAEVEARASQIRPNRWDGRRGRGRRWTKAGGDWLCLHCQREKAVEKATIGAKGDGWASRRQALLEFELRRSPEEPDGVIAKRANCSTGHVRKVREELEAGGKLPKAKAAA